MLFSVRFKRSGSTIVKEVSVNSNSLIKTQEDATAYIARLYPSVEIVPSESPPIPPANPTAAIVDTGPSIVPSVAQPTP